MLSDESGAADRQYCIQIRKFGHPGNIKFIASVLPKCIRMFFNLNYFSDAHHIRTWSKVLLEKLTVPKTVKKFPIF
jgi:hypothetical protein